MARDTWVVVAPDGCLTAYALCWAIHTANPVDLSFEVHPDHAGVGIDESLLGNLLARAREHLRSRPSTSRDSGIALWCPRGDERKETLYRRLGATRTRVFLRMAIDAAELPAAPPWPAGIAASPFRGGTDDADVHAAIDEAFSEHFLAVRLPLDIWQTVVLGDADFDPELFLVARDGPRVAGAVLCFPTPEAGIVDQLAVRKPWRGRGLGKALLLHAMHRMAARGHERFQLGVDSQNTTGAADLYLAVGMKTTRVVDFYEARLDAAASTTE